MKPRQNVCEAEESAPLDSRATNLGGHIFSWRVKQIVSILGSSPIKRRVSIYPTKAAEPIPHRSAHQGSPSGFGIACRRGLSFGSEAMTSGTKHDLNTTSSRADKLLTLN